MLHVSGTWYVFVLHDPNAILGLFLFLNVQEIYSEFLTQNAVYSFVIKSQYTYLLTYLYVNCLFLSFLSFLSGI